MLVISEWKDNSGPFLVTLSDYKYTHVYSIPFQASSFLQTIHTGPLNRQWKRPFSKVTCIINWKCLFVPFSDCFSLFHPLRGGILPVSLREDKFKMTVEVFAWKGFDFALSHCVMTHMLVEKWGDRVSEQKYSSSIEFSGWREKGFCLRRGEKKSAIFCCRCLLWSFSVFFGGFFWRWDWQRFSFPFA